MSDHHNKCIFSITLLIILSTTLLRLFRRTAAETGQEHEQRSDTDADEGGGPQPLGVGNGSQRVRRVELLPARVHEDVRQVFGGGLWPGAQLFQRVHVRSVEAFEETPRDHQSHECRLNDDQLSCESVFCGWPKIHSISTSLNVQIGEE